MLTPLSGVIACTDWERGQLGVTGSGPNQLNVPVPKTWLPHRQVLITDRANERIIEVDVATKRSLANGTTDVSGSDHDQLNHIEVRGAFRERSHSQRRRKQLPPYARSPKERQPLIRDQYNHRVIEVNRTKQIVRKLGKLGDLSYNHKSALIEDSTRRTTLNESATRRVRVMKSEGREKRIRICHYLFFSKWAGIMRRDELSFGTHVLRNCGKGERALSRALAYR